MSLEDCLEALSGYEVTFTAKGGVLSIKSPTLVLNDQHKAMLSAHKPLLLAILSDGRPYMPRAILNALEAYWEREAITLESGVPHELIATLSLEQAHRILNAYPKHSSLIS